MDGNLTPLQRFFLAFVAFFAVLFNRRFAEEVALVRARTRAGLPPGMAGTGSARAAAAAGAQGSARTATLNATATPTAASPQPPARPEPFDAAQDRLREAESKGPPLRGGEGDGRRIPTSSPSARLARAPAAPKPPDHAEALHVLSLLQRDGRLIDFLAEDLENFSDAEIGVAARTVHQGCKKALDAYLELEPVYRDADGATVTVAVGFDPAAVRLTGNVVGTPPFKGALRHHGWRAKRAAFPPPTQKDPNIIAPAEVEL
jgi:hypothetical protein